MKTVAFFEDFTERQDLLDYLAENGVKEKSAWLRDQMPKEQAFQDRLLKSLAGWKQAGRICRQAMIWKQGAAPYQRQGLPDILAVIDGRLYGFEVKRPFGVGVLTGIQRKTIEDIRAAGGVAEVVSFAREIKEILIREGAWKNE